MPIYKKKLETAIICLSNGKGGMELDAIKLAKLLGKKLPVVLICKENSFLHLECLEQQHDFSLETIDFFSKAFSLSIIFNLRKLINKRNINNVIFFGASELKSMFFSFLGKDINVVVRHGTTKSSKKNGLIHRLVYSCVNSHVAISEHINKNVSEIIPVNKGVEINTIYPSFPVEYQNKENWNNEFFKIIHVGRIASGKGQIDAVKACKILADNKIRFQLSIIGDVDDVMYYESLSKEIDSCKYNKSIKIISAVRNINEIYKSSDILLFPSYGEGLGNVFIEALATGLVCITYDNTVFPEFNDLGLHFHMAETGDLTLLSKNLLAAVSNFKMELSYVEHNLKILKEKFSEDREYNDWIKVIRINST